MRAAISILPDPSDNPPVFQFDTGAVNNNGAVFYPTLPDIPGPTSDWSVVEWHKGEYLDPSQMSVDNQSMTDPLYGAPLYSWETPDGESSFAVYSADANGTSPYVYQLTSTGGTFAPVGGANVLLQAQVPNGGEGWVTLNHPVTISMDAKISEASATYNSAAAKTDDSVGGQIGVGASVEFNVPSFPSYNPNLPTFAAFIQIYISDSNPGPLPVWFDNSGATATRGGTIDYGATLAGDPSLSWEQSQGEPQELTYNLNQYVEAMIQADASQLPAAAMDLSNWAVTALYLGLETNSSSPSDPNAGSLTESLQVSNLEVATDQSQTYNPADPPPGDPLTPNAQTFLFTDVTTGVSGQVQGSVYDGPVAGLTAQYPVLGHRRDVFHCAARLLHPRGTVERCDRRHRWRQRDRRRQRRLRLAGRRHRSLKSGYVLSRWIRAKPRSVGLGDHHEFSCR